MSENSCIHGFLHDWRHLRLEVISGDDLVEDVVVSDEWYCTRCRKIEQTER